MTQSTKKPFGKGKVIAAIGGALVGAAAAFFSRKQNRKAAIDKATELKGMAGKALDSAAKQADKMQKEGAKALESMKDLGGDVQKSAQKMHNTASKETKKVVNSAKSKADTVKKSIEKATKS